MDNVTEIVALLRKLGRSRISTHESQWNRRGDGHK
jgi:hypothetical protein